MENTIVAISTPPGEGGISVIRMSGERTDSIVKEIFQPTRKNSLPELEIQRVYFGKIVDPDSNQILDEVLLTFFKAPYSYTREDVAEIGAHGGLYVASRILQLILDRGARLAEPGEFTRRAFLNGRIDLTQAEAVADVISSISDRTLKSSLSQLQGKLSEKINKIYDRLIATLAQLETAIDFPEDGLEFDQREILQTEIASIKKELKQLAGTSRQAKIHREGVRVILIGKPNVGKSSLLNSLLQEDRAIVTPHPGTTRDLLEERIRIKDIHVVFIDSAGLRNDPEPIEIEGITRARIAMEQADLVLLLFDGSQPLDKYDHNLIKEARDKPRVVIVNKSDLPKTWNFNQLPYDDGEIIHISAKAGDGINNLIETIYSKAIKKIPETIFVTRERHREHLIKASEALGKTQHSFQKGFSEEFLATDIQYALNHLGIILGKIVEEDLLDKIFQEFCIGK